MVSFIEGIWGSGRYRPTQTVQITAQRTHASCAQVFNVPGPSNERVVFVASRMTLSYCTTMVCVLVMPICHPWHNLCLYQSGEHKARRWKASKRPTKDWIMLSNAKRHHDDGPFRPTHCLDEAWSSAKIPTACTMAQPLLPDTEANWLTLPCTRATVGFHRSPQLHGSRAIRLTAWGSARSLLPNLPDRQTPTSSALTSSQTSA